MGNHNAGPSRSKPTVLVLGVYHMANPGLDVIQSELDDHLSARRQPEIQAVVERLQHFQPTQIAIEAPYGSTGKLEQYQHFVAGQYTLTASEIDQIGFRLAKACNHPTLYPIDYPKELEFAGVMRYLQATGQSAVITRGQQEVARATRAHNELIRTHSVTEILRHLNTPEALAESHQPYLDMAKVGQDAVYIGADLVASWYERNLKIFVNLTRIVAADAARILVLIGVGHGKLLHDLIADSQQFELAQVQDYL